MDEERPVSNNESGGYQVLIGLLDMRASAKYCPVVGLR